MSKLAIVHESEVQRQHVRLQLPIKVQLENLMFDTDDWSSSGVALSWQGDVEKVFGKSMSSGHMLDAVLHFGFDGFELSMPVKLELRYLERGKSRAGFRFTNVNDRQLSLLHYVVSSYVSGELVRAGDLIQIAGRNNQLQSRSIPSQMAGLTPAQIAKVKMRKATYTAAVALTSMFALAYVLVGFYEHSFVVKAQSAEVKADSSVVMASAGGRAFFQPNLIDSKVKKGQPLAMIQTDKGSMVSVDSPCDCIVKELLVANQQLVAQGNTLVALTSMNAVPFVEARLPADEAVRLATGKNAVLDFTGNGKTIKGKISRIKVGESGSQALVTIVPAETLPVTWVDDPVDVSFDTLLFSK